MIWLRSETPNSSIIGLSLLVVSQMIMPLPAPAARRVNIRQGDRSLLADAAATRICVLLSTSTLLGLSLYVVAVQPGGIRCRFRHHRLRPPRLPGEANSSMMTTNTTNTATATAATADLGTGTTTMADDSAALYGDWT